MRKNTEFFTEKRILELIAPFCKNNPQCHTVFLAESQILIVEHLWNSDCIKFIFNLSCDQITELNNLLVIPYYDAIIHLDTNCIEFIYQFLDPKNPIQEPLINRSFEVNVNSEKSFCEFKEPSRLFYLLAKGFDKQSNIVDDIVPQFVPYHDSMMLERLPEFIQMYFNNRIARNFFIHPEKSVETVNIAALAKNVNFLMHFYDRNSPEIVIRDEKEKNFSVPSSPLRMIDGDFPKNLTISEMDDYVLQLLSVAKNSPPRFAFVYYYQIIEYTAFYYLDNKAKKELRQYLRNPRINECRESDLSQFFALLTETMVNDEARMQKVIEDYCNPSLLWKEIQNDKDFFSSQIVFEGDVTIPPFISADMSEESWKNSWSPKLFQNLTKIRNSIVHAREKRINNVIAPSEKNAVLISRILPIIQRTAEMIALTKE